MNQQSQEDSNAHSNHSTTTSTDIANNFGIFRIKQEMVDESDRSCDNHDDGDFVAVANRFYLANDFHLFAIVCECVVGVDRAT